MRLIILLLLAVQHSSHAEDFDSSRCSQEMTCFVPGDCDQETELFKTRKLTTINECGAVVAIRPYSKKKWLVAMRNTGKEGLSLLTKPQQSLLFECKPSEDKPEINVGPKLSKGRVFSTIGNQSYLYCEFEVISEQEILPPLGSQQVVLTGLARDWEKKTMGFVSEVDDARCDPDAILFDNATNDVDRYREVDARRFSVSCPSDWLLTMLQDDVSVDRNYDIISALDCTASGGGAYTYRVTHRNATQTDVLAPIYARCSQKRCLECGAVGCEGAGCIPPNFVAGLGSDLCARLECEGKRFELRGEGPRVGVPECRDGQWRLDGTAFTNASCSDQLDCAPLALECEGCIKTATSVSCGAAGAQMSIGGKDGSTSSVAVGGLICNGNTGKWTTAAGATVVNGSESIACAVIKARAKKMSTWKIIQAAGGMALIITSTVLLLITLYVMIRMWRRKPLPPTTTTVDRRRHGHEDDSDRDRRKKRHHSHGRTHSTSNTTTTTTAGAPSSTTGSTQREATVRSVSTGIPIAPNRDEQPPSSDAPAPSSRRPQQPQSSPDTAPPDDDHGYVIVDPAAGVMPSADAAVQPQQQQQQDSTPSATTATPPPLDSGSIKTAIPAAETTVTPV